MSFAGLGTQTHCANSVYNRQAQPSYIRLRCAQTSGEAGGELG
ncbi:hypothetical protein BGLT_04938 [Caballeronia glathei]|nr:hypothetical protein BGLT_04938 [Caballeronia glathei]